MAEGQIRHTECAVTQNQQLHNDPQVQLLRETLPLNLNVNIDNALYIYGILPLLI